VHHQVEAVQLQRVDRGSKPAAPRPVQV
jgi:hypothetical protein